MPEVRVTARTDQSATLTYQRIADFAAYPKMTEAVVSVDVGGSDADGAVISEWTVKFRNGLLRWTERDVLDPAELTITFVQLRGDFVTFTGTWLVTPATPGAREEPGATVDFEAEFDLGIPSLASIIDPVAASTLRSNILLILSGLLGDATEVTTPADMTGTIEKGASHGATVSRAGQPASR